MSLEKLQLYKEFYPSRNCYIKGNSNLYTITGFRREFHLINNKGLHDIKHMIQIGISRSGYIDDHGFIEPEKLILV